MNLQKNVWKQSGDLETHTVETHIYRLRKKILDIFKDNNFILNNNNGYKISNEKKKFYCKDFYSKKFSQKKVKT